MVATATWKHVPWSDPWVFTVPKTGLNPVYTLRGSYENVEKAFIKAINEEWYETDLFTTRGYKIRVWWLGEAQLRRGHKVHVLDITSKNCRKQNYEKLNLEAYVWQACHMSPMIGFGRCHKSMDDLFIR